MDVFEEAAEIERARARVYAFFSALLIESPTAERLDRLLTPDGETALEMLFPGHPAVEGFKQISRRHRSSCRQDHEFMLDYEALFRVPGASYVHPFESVYRHDGAAQKKGVRASLLGVETREVARIYQEEGLQPKQDFDELPDHLGAELEFVAFLSNKRAASLEREELEKAQSFYAKRASFLTEHLLQWSGKCLAKVRQNASTLFYAALATLLENFLENEQSQTFEAANF